MKRFLGGFALLLLAAGVCQAAPSARRTAPAKTKPAVVTRLVRLGQKSHKPKAPVTITVVPGPVISPGRQRVRIWVKPLVEAERIDVEVETRDGLALAEGRNHWIEAADEGVAVSEDLVLTATGPGERGLMVIATLHFKDGSTLVGYEALVLNPQSKPPGDKLPPGAREVIAPDGRRIIEIPIDTKP